MKYILRQDPDVILIGEMRDPETISAALTAAETGHLVLATLHTPILLLRSSISPRTPRTRLAIANTAPHNGLAPTRQ